MDMVEVAEVVVIALNLAAVGFLGYQANRQRREVRLLQRLLDLHVARHTREAQGASATAVPTRRAHRPLLRLVKQ